MAPAFALLVLSRRAQFREVLLPKAAKRRSQRQQQQRECGRLCRVVDVAGSHRARCIRSSEQVFERVIRMCRVYKNSLALSYWTYECLRRRVSGGATWGRGRNERQHSCCRFHGGWCCLCGHAFLKCAQSWLMCWVDVACCRDARLILLLSFGSPGIVLSQHLPSRGSRACPYRLLPVRYFSGASFLLPGVRDRGGG